MAATGDFDFLAEAARRSIKAAREACQPRPGDELPRRGDSLARHIGVSLDNAEKRLKQLLADYPAAIDEVERTAHRDNARLLHWALHLVHNAVQWHQRAFPPSLPLGTLYLVEEASSQLIGVRADVTVADDAGYAAMPSVLLALGLTRKVPDAPLPVVLFAPPSDRSLALLHVLLVHELGHVAVQTHSLAESVIQSADGPLSNPAFDRAVSALGRSSGITEPEARIELEGVLVSWVTELLCDDLAIAYAGPAYLYAFGAVVLPVSLTEPSKTHPPTSMRVGSMLENAMERGWHHRMKSSSAAVVAWLEWVASVLTPTTDPEYYRELSQACFECAGTIRSVTDAQIVGPMTMSAYDAVAAELEELMEHHILPAQHLDGSAMDRRSIWLAGWFEAFRRYDDSTKTLSACLDDGELQQHVSKGIEMSFVLEHWSHG